MYLRQPEIARIVVDSIHKGVELGHYELAAYVVMANHVHLLIRPLIAPDRLLKSLKGLTARHANRLLGRTGGNLFGKKNATTIACEINTNLRRSERTSRPIQ